MDSGFLLFLLKYGDIRSTAGTEFYHLSFLSQISLYVIALQSFQFYHSSRASRGAILVVCPRLNLVDGI